MHEPALDPHDIPVFDAALRVPKPEDHFWQASPHIGRRSYPPTAEAEAAGIAFHKRRLAWRNGHGFDWQGEASNDNQPWPLMKAIMHRAESAVDRDRLAAAARHYRGVDWLSGQPADLGGMGTEGFVILDQRVYFGSDGEIQHKGARKLARPAANDNRSETGAEDLLVARIDAASELQRLRGLLGPLLRPIEQAVVHGKSLTAIGVEEGFGNEASASAAGKALVYRGLRVIAGAASL